jgi:nicotinamide-nucleotide amidase
MRDVRTAEILAVGSELLTADRIDTNSLFLTRRLNEIGIAVRAKAVVGDDRGEVAAIFREALSRADVVITTGGLGPTDDDVTREAIAAVLDLPLEEHRDILESIRERFGRRGWVMPEINRRQALVPRGAVVLANARGTAPGLWIESGGRYVVLLPGPPRELEPMFDAEVGPRLSAHAHGRQIRRRVIKMTGRSESQIEEIAQPIYSTLGDADVVVQTTILATPGQIELHLAGTGTDRGAIDGVLDAGVDALTAAIGTPVFSIDGQSLEAVVGGLLVAKGWHLAAAESCTGGLLLGRMTTVPGSSAWVTGGVVAYADAVKIAELHVPAALIEEHGAVSEPVAGAMATGVRAALRADVGVGITGIAGPDGGTATKPVGTVVIAVATAAVTVRTVVFPGDREAVRRHATSAALDMVRKALAV